MIRFCLLVLLGIVFFDVGPNPLKADSKGNSSLGVEQLYTVRGTIKKLPSASSPRELMIRHEPIPNYVDETGKAVGMPAMTMPFHISDGLSIDGLKEGDQIEFTWLSRWHPKPEDRIIAIKKVG